MKSLLRSAVITLVLMHWESVSLCQAQDPPRFDWRVAAPESQGMSKAALDALKDDLARRKTTGFLVVRNDTIVYEWYAEGHGTAKTHGTASLAKALVGGVSLGIALTDGKIALDDPVAKFVPQWKGDSRKSRITIRHLGSHTSGLSDSTTPGVKHEDQPSWMGVFWKRLDPPNDPFTIARDQVPTLFDPGASLQYSNPGIGMLTYCVTAAVNGSEPKDVRSLLRHRVMRPIGVPDGEWSCGYSKTYTVDGLPLVAAWGGGAYTARATARVGRLLLREGDWDGRRLLSKEAVRQITGDAGLPGHCGMGFWTNAEGRYAYLPRDAYWGAGAGDQVLLVVPGLNLIVVRNGETLATPEELKRAKPKDVLEEYHDPRARILFEPIMRAITDRTGQEASKVIVARDVVPASDDDGGEAGLSALRQRLVEQVRASGVHDPVVLAALRTVPRHRFVPPALRDQAYEDIPLPIGAGQTISQPSVVALMTARIRARPGLRVLEIGTGSGYQAAVLAECVAPGEVDSIEIIPELGRNAETLLRALGYRNVHVRIGDGYGGWPERAPYDAIVLTAAPKQVPHPLLDQLRVGGRLVAPVGRDEQKLVLITRTEQGLTTEVVTYVKFVPMTGRAQSGR